MTTDSRTPRRAGSGLSWLGLVLGLAFGIGLGLLYTWEIDPVIEQNTSPWQLGPEGRESYVVAVALSYAYNRDLNLAFDRLRALRPDQDVWSMVADIACNRFLTGKTTTNSDVRVMRALEQLYSAQGASGCADGRFPTPAPVSFATLTPSITPTPSLIPPATKTPTPITPTSIIEPTSEPVDTPLPPGSYTVTRIEAFCNPALDGVIEVRVYDRAGDGVAGIPVQVTWGGNQRQTFYTGLKPERGPEYADFEMAAGQSYTVTIPQLVSAPEAVEALPCDTTADGQDVLTSYWVNFQQQATTP
jgi:hypothetical protein